MAESKLHLPPGLSTEKACPFLPAIPQQTPLGVQIGLMSCAPKLCVFGHREKCLFKEAIVKYLGVELELPS